MTFQQMHEKIDAFMDKSDLPWFNSEEKDIFLQTAANEYVKKIHSEFEVTEKRREDIRPLIKIINGGGSSVAIPTDYMFALSLKGTFRVTDKCGIIRDAKVPIKPAQHDDINKMKNDPFNKPTNEHPLYTSTSTSLEIESESTPSNWTLTYIKLPIPVDGTNSPTGVLDLPEYTHDEIVNLAVRKMLMSIEHPNYQVQINEINNQE